MTQQSTIRVSSLPSEVHDICLYTHLVLYSTEHEAEHIASHIYT